MTTHRVEKAREYQARWREANPERAAESARRRRKANPERVALAAARHYKANKEQIRATVKQRRRATPSVVREAAWKSADIRSEIDPRKFLMWPEFEMKLIAQGGCCANPYCLKELDITSQHTHADHCHDTFMFRAVLCAACNKDEGVIAKRGRDQVLWFLSMAAEFEELHRYDAL